MKFPLFKNLKFFFQDVKALATGRPSNSYFNHVYQEFFEDFVNDIKMFSRNPHYDAGKTGRLQDDWPTTADTPSQNFKQSWRILIARSIDAVDNNPHGISLLNTLQNNVVGKGMRPIARIKNKNGKLVDGLNKILDEGWKRYNDQWDASNNCNHMELQQVRFREIFTTGSTLTNLRPAPKENFLSIRNQMVNVLRLDESKDDITPAFSDPQKETKTVFGINLTEDNEAVSYYIQGMNEAVSSKFMRLNFRTKVAEQVIGQPWLIPALSYLWANRSLIKDELISSRIQAMISLFMPRDSITGIINKQLNANNQYEMESGRIYYGKKGEEPKVIQANNSIKDVLDPLQRLLLHAITTTQGVSYQTATRDLVRTNMASGRINVNEDRKAYRPIQKWLAKNLLQEDWNTYVKYMFMEGHIPGYSIVDYNKDPWYYNQVFWIPPGFDMVDPAKEGLAAKELISANMLTYEKWYGDQGEDWRVALKQRADENKFMEKLKLAVPDAVAAGNNILTDSEEEEEEDVEEF